MLGDVQRTMQSPGNKKPSRARVMLVAASTSPSGRSLGLHRLLLSRLLAKRDLEARDLSYHFC